MGVLYVAALLGILRPAAYGVIVAGVVALIIQRPRISRSLDGAPLPGGIAVSIAVFAWIAWKLQDATFVDWDVFSHSAGSVLILCIVHWKSGGLRRLLLAVGWLCALGVAFSVGLLVMYLFSFGPYEGTRLASYSRYMGILVLSILTVILAWALSGIDQERWRGSLSRLVTGGLVVTMACLTVPEAYQFFQAGPASMSPLRRQIRRLTRPAIKSTSPNARIYVLAFGSKGLAGYIARYELAPRVVNKGCFEIGSRRFPDDEWTCAVSVDQIRDVLREYDFVLLGPVDDIFWGEFGSLFAGRRDSTLFEVDKSGIVQLVAR